MLDRNACMHAGAVMGSLSASCFLVGRAQQRVTSIVCLMRGHTRVLWVVHGAGDDAGREQDDGQVREGAQAAKPAQPARDVHLL